ncbi:hypothetical protein FRC02_003895 [Tulasnella sp. 418]|nr:hypothetical protein FRC02_003895 [Tulasnella sp. 418]
MDTIQDIQKEMMTPLHGVYAPASERIRWHSIHEQNEITRLVNGYIEQLDKEQVAQYAAEKFLTYGKGAVMFNINYPVMQHKGSARFSYAGLGALKKTGDAVMTSIVRDYNPLNCCVMIFLKPSADLRSVDVWSLESYYPLPSFLQQEVREAIRDWEAMMAEESKKRDKKKKSK